MKQILSAVALLPLLVFSVNAHPLTVAPKMRAALPSVGGRMGPLAQSLLKNYHFNLTQEQFAKLAAAGVHTTEDIRRLNDSRPEETKKKWQELALKDERKRTESEKEELKVLSQAVMKNQSPDLLELAAKVGVDAKQLNDLRRFVEVTAAVQAASAGQDGSIDPAVLEKKLEDHAARMEAEFNRLEGLYLQLSPVRGTYGRAERAALPDEDQLAVLHAITSLHDNGMPYLSNHQKERVSAMLSTTIIATARVVEKAKRDAESLAVGGGAAAQSATEGPGVLAAEGQTDYKSIPLKKATNTRAEAFNKAAEMFPSFYQRFHNFLENYALSPEWNRVEAERMEDGLAQAIENFKHRFDPEAHHSSVSGKARQVKDQLTPLISAWAQNRRENFVPDDQMKIDLTTFMKLLNKAAE